MARAGRFTTWTAVVCATLAAAEPASAQHEASARIEALGGGAVSGIIPDYITDLYANPAFASFAGGLAINYGYRQPPAVSMPTFNIIDLDHYPRYYNLAFGKSHEVILYGVTASKWSFACAAQWRLATEERTTVEPVEDNMSSYGSFERIQYQYYERSDDEIWRIDAALSCAVGERSALGFRIGASGFYKGPQDRDIRTTYYYNFDPVLEVHERLIDGFTENRKRRFSLFAQAGLLGESDGGDRRGLTARVSLNDYYSIYHTYSLSVEKYYDDSNVINQYYYNLDEWRERREGDLYRYDLYGRYTFASGLRIFAGCGFGVRDYTAAWLDHEQVIRWGGSSENDLLFSRSAPGSGDYRVLSLFAKIGRTFPVTDTIDITAAFAAFGGFERSEERAVLTGQGRDVDLLGDTTVDITGDLMIDLETTELSCDIPLAVEFRPSGYFSLFSALVVNVTYVEATSEFYIPSLIDLVSSYYGLGDEYGAGGYGGKSSRTVTSTPRAAIGCSLRYRDRFFFDIYSGSDITPESITNLVLDARYTF
jgi:hypothetical protein